MIIILSIRFRGSISRRVHEWFKGLEPLMRLVTNDKHACEQNKYFLLN
jgi:hypothetical protein